MKDVKKIFWFSRHTMTEEQLADLKRIFGEVEIVQHDGTVKDAKEVVNACLEKGLLVLTAKTKIRLLPALNISYEEIDKGLNILKEVIEK